MAICLDCRASPTKLCALHHRTDNLNDEADMELFQLKDRVRELEARLAAAEQRATEAERALAIERLKNATASVPLTPVELKICGTTAPPGSATVLFVTCERCPHPGQCIGEQVCTCKTACPHRTALTTEEA
jgi:hypothetical protein